MAANSRFAPLALACLATFPGAAQNAEETLKKVDRFRYPWPSFSMLVTLEDGKLSQQWKVLVRENGDARVEGVSDKEKGRTVLLLDEQMWLLLPNAKRPVKISPQQRLLGPAAGGDIARFRFAGDYTLAAEREDALAGKALRRLELQARRKAMSYQKATLWITREGVPVRSDFFYASGKLARSAHFGPLSSAHGAQVLSSLRLEDPSGKGVELGFSQWKPAQAETRLFELPSVKVEREKP